ncbi:2Fe-2S iron-sulfur cluster-binding protein [Rhodomicrobium lacus]|uniref:2Fe-2S iron-sulfur cluster-binding protein n=1 Tax=Rhodomicrobium lacus TaxID=2498452 RepID=UPI0026E265C3|nr:2Fe-2S iron-sulfur cluster-binding protein [Rhodomicrobium lacus]WKW49653.1 2Fe-2S iron-sulfur cluster-binding protein [Rhodomicrobium lacus]
MANITFSSPSLAKDVTVYAVAGDRGTILAVAKDHKIPIPFDCQDGECGSCLIEVKQLDSQRAHAISLTEKEKEQLRQLGKITAEEIKNAETSDVAPRFRLACQYIVRDEDIIVSFVGDETVPAKGPAVTKAARVYKGGTEIRSLEEFFGYAVKVEEDAAIHYDQLSKSMADVGNTEVAELFAKLAEFSRLHLAEAQKRAGTIDPSLHIPADYVWPDHVTPERTALWAGDPTLSRLDALKAALQGEKRGYEFYYAVAHVSKDPAIVAEAKQFVKEEAEHVAELEKWIAREEYARKG